MDYFARTQEARRLTAVVFALTLAVYVASSLVATAAVAVGMHALGLVEAGRSAWTETLSMTVSSVLFTFALGFASWRTWRLRFGGGSREANRIGAPRFRDERVDSMLDEIALTVGIPVPLVHWLDTRSVNAFSLGTAPTDAVVVLTRGALELDDGPLRFVLSREAVRIADGDMLLNVRIAAMTRALTWPATVAYALRLLARRSPWYARPFVLGAWIGPATVSLPLQGCAQALRSLAHRVRGSFPDAAAGILTGSTQPSAAAIRSAQEFGSRLDRARTLEYEHALFAPTHETWLATRSALRMHATFDERLRFVGLSHGKLNATLSYAEATIEQAWRAPDDLIESFDDIDAEHLRRAHLLLDGVPESIRAALRDPLGVHAIICTLLARKGNRRHDRQRQRFTEHGHPDAVLRGRQLHADVAALDPALWIGLADLATPALRAMSPEHHQVFARDLAMLINPDAETLEFVTASVWMFHARAACAGGTWLFGWRRGLRKSDWPSLIALALMLARIGNSDERTARIAFGTALQTVDVPAGKRIFSDVNERIVGLVGEAIARFRHVESRHQRRVLHSALIALAGDRPLAPIEAETVRGLGRAFGCALPPQADPKRASDAPPLEPTHDRVLVELWHPAPEPAPQAT